MGDGKSATIDNFRLLSLYQGSLKMTCTSRRYKGHEAGFWALVDPILQGNEAPIPLEHLVLSSLATLGVVQALQCGGTVPVDATSLVDDTLERPTLSPQEA